MIGYLDCSTGVSGDKFLGALLDAGSGGGEFTAEHLSAIVSALAPEARVVVERVRSHGISAMGLHVEADSEPPSRSWARVREMLETAELAAPVRERALAAFAALAQAESLAHGCALDDVHFHEVGAIDSIADIVGVCAGLHALGITSLVASPVAVGSGTVDTSHGVLPVPAPATARLLEGMPITAGPATGELTTPTGAALLRAAAASFGPCPRMTPVLVGYGAGTRDIGVANVCQLILGEPAPEPASLSAETVALLETNVDHISPEAVAIAADQLLAEGALDVWVTPIVMKKGRAALTLSVLVPADTAEKGAERVVALTGSLGVRVSEAPRFVAQRESAEIATPWGPVRVKLGAGRLRPEADDVARIAAATGRPADEVAATLTRLAHDQLEA